MANSTDAVLTVMHAVARWLPLTENWIYQQIQALPAAIESHILCESRLDLQRVAWPFVHAFDALPRWRRLPDVGLRSLGLRRHLGFFVSKARRYGASILHSHFGNVGWVNVGVAREARLKHVVSFYGFDMSYLPAREPMWRQRYRVLFEQVDRVLCEGPAMAHGVKALGCPPEKIRIHHLGIRVQDIAFQPRAWRPSEPLRILVAATFQEKKGIPDALAAVAQLRRAMALDVTVIGDAAPEARSHAEKRRILDVIERHDLKGVVRLLGYQPHDRLLAEAHRHHVLLAPSTTASDGDTEGGVPVGLMELAATGMPVVSTRHADIPHILQHQVTGLLVPERDVGGLVEQLEWLVRYPERWAPLARACRAHLESEYEAVAQGQRLAHLYAEIVPS